MPASSPRIGHRSRAAATLRRPTRAAVGAALATIVALGASLAGASASDARTLATVTPVARILGAPLAIDQFQWFVGLTTDGRYLYAADRGRIVKLDTDPTRAVASFDASRIAPFLVRTPRSPAGLGSAVMAANSHAVFASDGTRIVRIGSALDGSGVVSYGSAGSGRGQFAHISGLAALGDWLYVADAGNHRVVRIPQTLDDSDWAAFGSAGAGPGQFDALAGIAVNDLSLFVVDAGSDRIIRTSPAMDGSGWTEIHRPGAGMHGALLVKGQELYTRSTDCTADLQQGVLRVPVSLSSSSVGCQLLPPTDVIPGSRSFATDIAVVPTGTYMGVDAYDSGLIELRRLYADSPTVADTFGTPAYGALGQLTAPLGSAVSGDTLYICDRASTAPLAETRIIALRRSDRSFVAQIPAPCSASRFAADGGFVYGADDTTVYRFRGPDLAAAGQYGQDGTGTGGFGRIDALAASGGTVYAVDGGLGRVVRFAGDPFDGTGWRTVTGIPRVGADRTFAGADSGTLAVANVTPAGVKVYRIAASLRGKWQSRALLSGRRAVTAVGGLDVDAGRVYLTSLAVAGRRSVAVLVLGATDLATVGLGVNRSVAPAKLVTPNGIAAEGSDLYVADGGTPAGPSGAGSSGSITVWTLGSAR